MLKGFGEPKKYGVFLSMKRCPKTHWPAREMTGVLKGVLTKDSVMVAL
jgi:hypothetical protein